MFSEQSFNLNNCDWFQIVANQFRKPCHPRTWEAFDSQPVGEMTALPRHGCWGEHGKSLLSFTNFCAWRSVMKLKGIQHLRPLWGGSKNSGASASYPAPCTRCQVRPDGYAHHGYPRHAHSNCLGTEGPKSTCISYWYFTNFTIPSNHPFL